MNSKYLDKLEYNEILEMLEGFAKTYLGKNLCRRLHPSTNVSFLLEVTNENVKKSRRCNCNYCISICTVFNNVFNK